ncbi:hypothetical protein [Streptomyces sp. NPDC094468]|uniref:hypothetical protein n=1 Tax=Streptomyces sp. NPDC094468 TaxID=3366066 RepID=UPI00382202BA
MTRSPSPSILRAGTASARAPPPDDIAWLWTLAALIAALQALLTASIGFSAAKER